MPDRTEHAIVRAAVVVLGGDPTASLGDVAAQAGVGRTTLHRHFPDRAALVAAVDAHARDAFGAAAERARADEGRASGALRRLCAEFLELGPLLRLVFADGAAVDPGSWTTGAAADPALAALFARGQSDGSFDAKLPPEWMVMTTWLLLYGAWLVTDGGHAGRADATALLDRTLHGALGPKSEAAMAESFTPSVRRRPADR